MRHLRLYVRAVSAFGLEPGSASGPNDPPDTPRSLPFARLVTHELSRRWVTRTLGKRGAPRIPRAARLDHSTKEAHATSMARCRVRRRPRDRGRRYRHPP